MLRLFSGQDLMINVEREGIKVKNSAKVSILRNQVNGLPFNEVENTGGAGGLGRTIISNTVND